MQEEGTLSAGDTDNAGANSRVTVPDILTDGLSLGSQWKVMDAEYVRAFAAQLAENPSGPRGELVAEIEIAVPSRDPIVVAAVSTELATSTDEMQWTLVVDEALALEISMTRAVAPSPDVVSSRSAGDGDDVAAVDDQCGQELTFPSLDTGWTLAQVGVRHVGSSNVDVLRGLRLQAAIETPGATVGIRHPEHGLMLSFATPMEAEPSTGVYDRIDVFDDLVRIAELSETDLGPLEGFWTSSSEVDLRRIRLLWEGQIVQYVVRLSGVTTATATPPPAVVVPATTFEFANLQLPVPTLLHRHPGMAPNPRPTSSASEPDGAVLTTSEGPVAEAGGAQTEARVVWDISVPDGERFCTWAPERRAIPSDDDLHAAIAASPRRGTRN